MARYVLLPGDPKRSERISKHFDESRRVAEYRQFITYTGNYRGVPVSVTSTGIGCPSTAIAVEELRRIGADTLIRVGTTGALQEDIDIGDIVIAHAAVRMDGATRAYVPIEYPAVASLEVSNALIEAARRLGVPHRLGIVWTSDAFYAEDPELVSRWGRAGVLSVEMECSMLFTLCGLRGLRSGAILAVDGNLIRGEKKGEFEPGERKGELDERVQEAIDLETRVALDAIRMLDALEPSTPER